MSFPTFSAEGINWSISKLFMYEQCPLRFKLKYIDKCKELPPEANSPLERGNRIHKKLEDFVTGKVGSLQGIEAKGIGAFDEALAHLRVLYECGQATVEQDWFFDQDWNECSREKVDLWVKLDFGVKDEENARVITADYKSGKSKYKAVDHIQQTQLYAAVSAVKYPWADVHVTEVWYVDEGWIRSLTYTREEALRFIGRFQARSDKIYNDKLFRANANAVTCKWCPFRRNGGTGACPVAAA